MEGVKWLRVRTGLGSVERGYNELIQSESCSGLQSEEN